MRFTVELELEKDSFPKDKNRVILSLFKTVFQDYDEEFYQSVYSKGNTSRKSFTFSTFLGLDSKFHRDSIEIPSKKIMLNLSTYSMEFGMGFYSSMVKNKNKELNISGNLITIRNISLVKEEKIISDFAILKTMSPICVRSHSGNNKETWYHSLDTQEGIEVFTDNLRIQLLEEFGISRIVDIEQMIIEVLNCKTTKVKHYGIVIPANLCTLQISGAPYLIEYLYQSGIGSLKSSGFGMLNIVRR